MRTKSRTYHVRVPEELAEKLDAISRTTTSINAAIVGALYKGVGENGEILRAERMTHQKLDANNLMLATTVLFVGGAWTGSLGILLLSFLACAGFLYVLTRN